MRDGQYRLSIPYSSNAFAIYLERGCAAVGTSTHALARTYTELSRGADARRRAVPPNSLPKRAIREYRSGSRKPRPTQAYIVGESLRRHGYPTNGLAAMYLAGHVPEVLTVLRNLAIDQRSAAYAVSLYVLVPIAHAYAQEIWDSLVASSAGAAANIGFRMDYAEDVLEQQRIAEKTYGDLVTEHGDIEQRLLKPAPQIVLEHGGCLAASKLAELAVGIARNTTVPRGAAADAAWLTMQAWARMASFDRFEECRRSFEVFHDFELRMSQGLVLKAIFPQATVG